MEKKIILILLLSILSIVCFVNFNNDDFEHICNLIYYSQYYIIVFAFIVLMWVLFTNKLIRILTIPIGIYYLFHLIVNVIEIFNPELKDYIYKTKYINYCLSISMALSICIIPCLNRISKIIKEAITKLKHRK